MRVPLGLLLLFVAAAPIASAQQVRLWLDPVDDDVEGAPEERLFLEYEWNVDFIGTSCPAGTEFGVDFFPHGPPPLYGGASFVPQATLARYPNVTSGRTTLELFLADTAPVGQSTTFELGTGLGMQNAAGCTPQPTRREESSSLTLTVTEPQTTSESAGEGENGLPSPAVVLALAAVSVVVAVRRRR